MTSSKELSVLIGKRIAQYRTAKGVTQAELGAQLDPPISLQQIQKYERGANRVSAPTIIQIAAILEISTLLILHGEKLTVNVDRGVTKHMRKFSQLTSKNRQAVMNLVDQIFKSQREAE
jgi:transcriptional regulator with XRE-family HTH domain